MKQKIQCEIEIEADQEMEFVGYRRAKAGECYLLNGELFLCDGYTTVSYPIFRPVEPPLELETGKFLVATPSNYIVDDVYIQQYVEDGNEVIKVCRTAALDSPAEARDLAKILNYWAGKGRLPKVKLRGAE